VAAFLIQKRFDVRPLIGLLRLVMLLVPTV